jgi:signal transduction histidine kinase
MPKRFDKFLRLRFTVPLLIVAVISLALIGELGYRRTVKTLGANIALADARIGTAQLLQLLTHAETAQRAYLLTGRSSYLLPLRRAQTEIKANAQVFRFINAIGKTGPDDARQIYQGIADKLAELDRTIVLADAGNHVAAIAVLGSDDGRQEMDELRSMFDKKFKEAAVLQQDARQTVFTTLWFGRTLVAVLSLLVAAGLYLHLLQMKRHDLERSQRQSLLEQQVAERTHELRTLARYLQTAREDEKSHLARELHDELGGKLTAAKMTLARMRARLQQDPAMLERIEHIDHCLSDGIALKRRILEDLRPSTLSTLGLNAALEVLFAEVRQQMPIAVASKVAKVRLTPDAELGIFRVVQEALSNIAKHAGAREVLVRLEETPDELHLEVSDNGIGFDVTRLELGQHGLAGMRFQVESLNGSLSVISQVGQGVKIVAKLPRKTVEAGGQPNA